MNTTIPADVRRVAGRADGGREGRARTGEEVLSRDLAVCRVLCRVMDAQFEVAGVRFGADALVGLIPGVGDVVGMVVGAYPVYVAQKHGVSRGVRLRMVGNLVVDFLAGAVPVVGDVIDVAFRANLRNLKLLEEALEKKGRG